MNKKILFFGLFTLSTSLWVLSSGLTYPFKKSALPEIPLVDLTAFKDAGKSWHIVGDVSADLQQANVLTTRSGAGILVNLPTKKEKGTDLFTVAEYGDVTLSFDYLMSSQGNSGIYLQGRYEVQLEDSWTKQHVNSASNGGIYDLSAPRVNASKAPGLWQHVKISFKAPRFDASGNKIENAKIESVELNGYLVQENVELLKPTPGAVSDQEVAKAPLRIQGDHGAVAFRNLEISIPEPVQTQEDPQQRVRYSADPILVEAPVNTILRSFIDLDENYRVVHAVSVGSGENVHYTYDMDYGALVQIWRGGFLDATPMWDGRGNGTSRPMGVVQRFGKPVLGVAQLENEQATWPTDTVGSGYRPRGYTVNAEGLPTFVYQAFGAKVLDASTVLPGGTGIKRNIQVEGGQQLYVRIAKASSIKETVKGTFLVGDKAYYVQLSNPKDKTIIRNVDGEQELIVPITGSFNYSILF